MSNLKPLQIALLFAGGAIAAAAVFFGVKADRLARIGAGYKAKIACSEIFLAQRNSAAVLKSEFAGMDPMMDHISVHIDADKKIAAAAGPLGFGRARAVFRENYGCTLANAGRIRPLPVRAPTEKNTPWPEAPPVSGAALHHVDYAALDFALSQAFDKNDANNRAIVVVADGKIIDERYAEGFSKNTPFLSWSAAKSVTATLVGTAVLQGYIDITDPAPVSEWQEGAIRFRHYLERPVTDAKRVSV